MQNIFHVSPNSIRLDIPFLATLAPKPITSRPPNGIRPADWISTPTVLHHDRYSRLDVHHSPLLRRRAGSIHTIRLTEQQIRAIARKLRIPRLQLLHRDVVLRVDRVARVAGDDGVPFVAGVSRAYAIDVSRDQSKSLVPFLVRR